MLAGLADGGVLFVKQETLSVVGGKPFFPSVIYFILFMALTFVLQKLYIFMWSKVSIVLFLGFTVCLENSSPLLDYLYLFHAFFETP